MNHNSSSANPEEYLQDQQHRRFEAAAFLRSQLPSIPKVVVELGTGQGDFAELLENKIIIPYSDISHFRVSTAPYHKGRLIYGCIQGKPVLIMQGRLHLYEGYTFQEVTFPVRVFHELGINVIVICNGGGACNPIYRVGDLMLITDHINLLWGNPLVGPNDSKLGPKFVDMTDAYSSRLRAISRRIAANSDIPFHEGVYVANIGPTFETPAETMLAFRLGGDLVGMSSVPDVIVARHMNMEVLGISQVGNRAAGLHQGKLEEAEGNHEIVLNENFSRLLWNVLVEIL